MKTAIHMFIVLTIITVLSGAALSSLDGVTAPKIKEHRLRELKASIAEVLPPYDSYTEVAAKETMVYVGKKAGQDTPVGVAFRVVGSGFQGKIAIMVGLKPDFSELTGIKILEQIETPGLGTKIVEDSSNKEDPFWFTNQFKGKHTSPELTALKNQKPSSPTEVQAISGATISAKAVTKILNENISRVKNIYQASRGL